MRLLLLLSAAACVAKNPKPLADGGLVDDAPDDAAVATIDAPGCAIGATGCVATLPLHYLAGTPTQIYLSEPQPCSSVQPLCSRLSAWDRIEGVIRPVLSGGSNPIPDGTTLVAQGTYVDSMTTLPQVVACPQGNCSNALILASGNVFGASPGLVAAFGGLAYIIDGGTKELFTCPETGCQPRTVLVPAWSPSTTNSFVVDASGLYLTDNGDIKTVPAGGSLSTIVTGSTAELALDSTTLYLRTPTAVTTCPKAATACTPTPLITGTAISGFQPDTTKLYWKDGDIVYSCAKPACTTPTPFYTCPANSSFFADDDFIYCAGTTTLQVAK